MLNTAIKYYFNDGSVREMTLEEIERNPPNPETVKARCAFSGSLDINGTRVYEGDIVRTRIQRLSSSQSTWCKIVNENHGDVYVTKMIEFVVPKSDGFPYENRYSVPSFQAVDVPGVTSEEKKALEAPIGTEKYDQVINDLNVIIGRDCEVIGNVNDK